MTQPQNKSTKRKHLPGPTNYITSTVGKNGKNREMDIINIISLLKLRRLDPYYKTKLNRLKISHTSSQNFTEELETCIYDFQKCIQGENKADGIVSPAGSTILYGWR